MNNLDEIYNQALEMLKKGSSKEEALLKFAEYKNELAPLLDISSVLLSVPKNIVPTPLMRRQYAIVPAKRLWLAWLHISKFAGVSVGLMLLISALSVTVYQAESSTPGNALFALKKGGENLQLILSFSQSQKASLQVAIAQQRLSDAQQIFNDPASNEQQKTAALNELSAQTASAVAEVNTVAVSDPKSADSPPLLSSLDSITKQQKTLLTAIRPDSQIKTAANSALVALGSDTAKLSAIKQTIAVAANDQEALAKLSSDPNSIAAFGPITQASSSQITVEQITFAINSQTVIKDDSGGSLLPADLKDGDKASVVGEKNNNQLLAQQIFITNTSADSTSTEAAAGEPAVKSAITQTSNGLATATASSTLSSAGIKKTASQNSTSTQPDQGNFNSSDANNTSTVTGTFIIETPAPQAAN
jgi:Domain of unknown function (DUF5666)/Domain of unknown function (DUF5667)